MGPSIDDSHGAELHGHTRDEPRANGPTNGKSVLPTICNLGDLLAQVDAAGDPAYLIRGVMAEGDHGMLSAEFKAGKTWAVTDLAVSVASGTPWMNGFEIDAPGPVLLFAGEGGARKIARRIRAICDGRGIDPTTLTIRIGLSVPHLTNEDAMLFVEEEIAEHRPALVIIDPLYLAAAGANSSDIFDMGGHLQQAQAICQRHRCGLLIAHHWNLTGRGGGAKRMSGAGPEAWGRVLISMEVLSRSIDPQTLATDVSLEIEFQGDEIAERRVRIRRQVWADDADDLASPLHYVVSPVGPAQTPSDPRVSALPPAARKVLAILEESETELAVSTIVSALTQRVTGWHSEPFRTPWPSSKIPDLLSPMAWAQPIQSYGGLLVRNRWKLMA